MQTSRSERALPKIRTRNREGRFDVTRIARDSRASVPPAVAGAAHGKAAGCPERRCGRLWSPHFSGSDGCGLGREAGDRQRPCCCGRHWRTRLRLRLRTPVAIALAVVVTLIGIPAATQVARGSGIKDPQFVVIDEVAGQLVSSDRRAARMEIFSGGLYTFSCLRYRQTAAGATIGGASGRRRDCAGRHCRRSLRAGNDASLATLWSSNVVRVFSSWDSPTASWARKA